MYDIDIRINTLNSLDFNPSSRTINIVADLIYDSKIRNNKVFNSFANFGDMNLTYLILAKSNSILRIRKKSFGKKCIFSFYSPTIKMTFKFKVKNLIHEDYHQSIESLLISKVVTKENFLGSNTFDIVELTKLINLKLIGTQQKVKEIPIEDIVKGISTNDLLNELHLRYTSFNHPKVEEKIKINIAA